MKKIIEAVKRCFKKESYADQSVYKINISMIASCVLFCLACVLFFLQSVKKNSNNIKEPLYEKKIV